MPIDAAVLVDAGLLRIAGMNRLTRTRCAMPAITELLQLQQAADELVGRISGPLHFRLIIQPVVATVLAIRAGLRDARAGQPAFLWEIVTHREERRRLVRSGWKDIGKVFMLAVLLDLAYQLIVLRGVRPLQTLIVAVALAIVPYVLIRGPVTRISRRRRPGGRSDRPAR